MSHFLPFLHCHGLGAKCLTLSFSDLRSRKLSLLLPQSVLRRWFFAVFAFLHDRYTMLWQVRRLAVCLTISATHWQTRCVRTQIHSSQEIHSMLKHWKTNLYICTFSCFGNVLWLPLTIVVFLVLMFVVALQWWVSENIVNIAQAAVNIAFSPLRRLKRGKRSDHDLSS